MSTATTDHQGREMFPRPADPAYISTGEAISLILDLRFGPGAGNDRRPSGTTPDGRAAIRKPKKMAQAHRDAHEDMIEDLVKRRYLAYVERPQLGGGVKYEEAAYREFWTSTAGKRSVAFGRLMTDIADDQSKLVLVVKVADIHCRYDNDAILPLRSMPAASFEEPSEKPKRATLNQIEDALKPIVEAAKSENRYLGLDRARDEIRPLFARRDDVNKVLNKLRPRRSQREGRPATHRR